MLDICCGTHLSSEANRIPSVVYLRCLISDRPETVESLFIAYRLTGDEIYREHGWKIFQAIEKHARVSTGGYATVLNVDANPAELEDKMETFFLVSIVIMTVVLYIADTCLERDIEIPLPALLRLGFATFG